MSTWGPAGVARFARAAGFKGAPLHEAVALSLAATAGRDHYAHNVISAPGAERRGLWAIRLDEVPPELIGDLFDPAHAARVARALWQAASGSFGWHPVWISGAARDHLAYVPSSRTGEGAPIGPGSGLTYNDHLARVVARSEAFARALDVGQVPGG